MTTKELLQERESKAQLIWIRIFQIIGIVMFLAGIWESLVTLFWLGKEVVKMDNFKIGFCAAGFVFAGAGKQLGVLANNLGIILVNKFK